MHEDRGLKGRPRQAAARRATRNVPIPSELVTMLAAHIERFGTAEDGRLFRSENGNPIQPSTYRQVWTETRALALTPRSSPPRSCAAPTTCVIRGSPGG